jgi:anti-anti-sigma regulatory factor
VVVRLRGEAGVAEVGLLEDSLWRLPAGRPARVTFDLSELRSISSLALRVLAAHRRAAVRAGARVCLAPDLHPEVRAALDKVELTGLFEGVGSTEPGGGPAPVAEGAREPYPNVEDVQRAFGVAWAEVVELEPRVEALLGRARMAGAHCRTFAEVARAFGPLRNDLAGLIGFAGEHQRHPLLGSDGAYEVAYWKLYDAVAGLLPGRPGAEAAPANQ